MQRMKVAARAVIPRTVRNWVRSPVRSVRWGAYEVRARVGSLSRLDLRPSCQFRSHPAAYPFAYHAQMDDPDQVAEFDQFLSRCRGGMRLFDLGAHFGLFSLAALQLGGPSARATAVDPSPLAVRMMRFQARVNGLQERLQVIQACAGAGPGELEMVAAGIESAGYFVPPAMDHPSKERTKVRIVSVDNLAIETGPPTHLKIDVEGFEADALRGASVTLCSAAPPLVFLELHTEIIESQKRNPAEPLEILASAGYHFLDVHGTPVNKEHLLSKRLVRLLAVQTKSESQAARGK